MRRKTAHALLMGVGCAVVGFLIGRAVNEVFCASATTSAFLTGATLWWSLIENAGPNSIIRGTGWVRGGIVGGLAGFLAHFVCWFFYAILMNPATALIALGFSLVSIPFVGPITIPSGMLVGALLGLLRLPSRKTPQIRGKATFPTTNGQGESPTTSLDADG